MSWPPLWLTFLHTPLRRRQHLVDSEGVGSLFDALVLHLLDVRQAVHGTAEVCFPCLGVWTGHAWLVLAYTNTHTHTESSFGSYFWVKNIFKKCRFLIPLILFIFLLMCRYLELQNGGLHLKTYLKKKSSLSYCWDPTPVNSVSKDPAWFKHALKIIHNFSHNNLTSSCKHLQPKYQQTKIQI